MTHSTRLPSTFDNPFPFSLYRVGGAVRDELLHYPYEEVDWVVVGATPDDLLQQGFQAVGKDFPVFLHPTTKEEYALARTERKSGRGYRGFICHSSPHVTLEEDLRRRDLTINAMAQASDGHIVDPYGGQKDLTDKILRHVSDAFEEDPVRILRIARFSARYHHLGFTIATETQHLLHKMVLSGEADHLVAERVWKECERAHGEKSPAQFWQTLFDCQALNRLAPDLHNRFAQSGANVQLTTLFTQISEQSARFAGLLLWVNFCADQPLISAPLSLTQLLPTLPIPKAVQTDTQCALSLWQWLTQSDQTHLAEDLLEVFIRCNAFKQASAWQAALWLCHRFFATAQNWITPPSVCSTAQIQQRLQLAQPALEKAQTILPSTLMAQGYQGKALGDALKQARLTAIRTRIQD